MAKIIDALKRFYTKNGGSATDVKTTNRIPAMIDKISDLSLGGGGDSNIFEVHYAYDDSDKLICLETKDQIIEAIENNKTLIGKLNPNDDSPNITLASSRYLVADMEGTKALTLIFGGLMDEKSPFDEEREQQYERYLSMIIIHAYAPDQETGDFVETITEDDGTIYGPYTPDITEGSNNEWTFNGNADIMYNYCDNGYGNELHLLVSRQNDVQRYVLNFNGKFNNTGSGDSGFRFCGMAGDKYLKVIITDKGNVTVTEYSLS